MHHHHVDRMADQGDRRADIEAEQLEHGPDCGTGSRDRLAFAMVLVLRVACSLRAGIVASCA